LTVFEGSSATNIGSASAALGSASAALGSASAALGSASAAAESAQVATHDVVSGLPTYSYENIDGSNINGPYFVSPVSSHHMHTNFSADPSLYADDVPVTFDGGSNSLVYAAPFVDANGSLISFVEQNNFQLLGDSSMGYQLTDVGQGQDMSIPSGNLSIGQIIPDEFLQQLSESYLTEVHQNDLLGELDGQDGAADVSSSFYADSNPPNT
jgi:hypothetical protein